jgi:hypothetical protein
MMTEPTDNERTVAIKAPYGLYIIAAPSQEEDRHWLVCDKEGNTIAKGLSMEGAWRLVDKLTAWARESGRIRGI